MALTSTTKYHNSCCYTLVDMSIEHFPHKCQTSFVPLVNYDKQSLGNIFLKLINNSQRENKGNHYRDRGLDTGS